LVLSLLQPSTSTLADQIDDLGDIVHETCSTCHKLKPMGKFLDPVNNCIMDICYDCQDKTVISRCISRSSPYPPSGGFEEGSEGEGG
jgi:hypothetical protein